MDFWWRYGRPFGKGYVSNVDPETREKYLAREIEIEKYKNEHQTMAYMMIAEHIGRFWN